MSIILLDNKNVNNKASVLSLGEMNGALSWVDNASGSSSPPLGERESTLAFILSNDTSRGGLSEKTHLSNPDNACHLDNGLEQDSFTVPTGLDGLDSTNCDRVDFTAICKDFDNYLKGIEESKKLFAHLKNEGQGLEALVVIDRVSGSRYFPEGRAKIRRKILKRIKKQKEKGIYLVFTVDTKEYDLIEAWNQVWENFKLWRDAINAYRKRHMNARWSLHYVAVLEMCESGYPHLNVFFPGLRVLIKKNDFNKVDDWWKMGNVQVEKEWKPQSACSYILKYISKMEGWTNEIFAILWHYGIRLWNMSHCMYNELEATGWVLVDIYKSISIEYLANHFGIEADKDARFVLINSS
jgi:hypothetical protein